jgi:hypothetical protein
VMPAKSKAQYRFMQAVARGSIKAKGLSRKEAREFVEGVNYRLLPERSKRNGGVHGKHAKQRSGLARREG